MFNTDKQQLSLEEAKRYIDVFKTSQLLKLEKMKRYYDAKNDTIMNRSFKDSSKPNNKVSTPYCSYISNVLTGYFNLGATTYTSQNEEFLTELSNIYYAQDEHTKNNQLALDASIYGVSYELLYINENKQIAFDTLDPRTIITIYDNTISQNLLFAIRFWETKDILSEKTHVYIEVYSRDNVKYYCDDLCTNTQEHFFKKVPINVYRNTKGFTSDFEKLIKLVDAYDIAISDTLNDREALNDSYLCFYNTNLEDESILKMKENKVIQVESPSDMSQAKIEWLTKDTVSAEAEALKSRLQADIEKFSYISELEVKSHTSATGNTLQLISLESLVQQKEYYAKKALINRIDMICNHLNLLGSSYNTKDINISMIRNMPLSLDIQADIASKLSPYISKETLLSQLPFVTDVKLELDRIKAESEINAYANMIQTEGE